jgi:hypothetical protein
MVVRLVLGGERTAGGEGQGDEESADPSDYSSFHLHRSLSFVHPTQGQLAQLPF